MKFVIAAVVVLAVAMGVQSSIVAGIPSLGLGINGLGLGVSNIGLVNGHGLGVANVGLVNGLGINGLAINNLGIGAGHLGGAQSLVQGPALLGAGIILHSQIPAAVNIAASPLIASAHIPAAVAVAPHGAAIAAPLVSGHGHGATYVAKTRGAIHTAPLAGHIKSTASVNVAPAPGTW